jgi:hypothetical protein
MRLCDSIAKISTTTHARPLAFGVSIHASRFGVVHSLLRNPCSCSLA